jgi:predicted TPR repeat methyltransferase
MSEAPATHDVSALVGRARFLLDQGQLPAARTLLSAVARLAAPSPTLWETQAWLALREGDAAGACAVLDRAVAAQPGSAPLRLCRAGARAAADDFAGALQDAAEAVLLAPRLPGAKALLGALLLELRRAEEALACLTEAVADAPSDLPSRLALARAQEVCGAPVAAAATLAEGAARHPLHAGLRTEAVLLAVRRGAFDEAVRLAGAARRDGCADACALGLLGHSLSSLGRHDAAADAYAAALHLAPEDAYVRHLVAATGRIADAGRAPASYVRTVFDGYAARFDAHLLGLGYRVPALARAALAGADVSGPVLDLGCGTGLMALALADLAPGPWIGVDLSPRMLALAAARGCYAELHEADLPDFLGREARRFALILAGDVLPYFGDLTPLFAAVAARLAPGGRFVCSVESLPGAAPPGDAKPWRLGTLGRYRHTAAHLTAAAAVSGLAVARLDSEIIRTEQDEPVPGLFAVLRGGAP